MSRKQLNQRLYLLVRRKKNPKKQAVTWDDPLKFKIYTFRTCFLQEYPTHQPFSVSPFAHLVLTK